MDIIRSRLRLMLVKNSSNEKVLKIEPLPSLPITIANACGAIVGDTLYVAGGQQHADSPRTLNQRMGDGFVFLRTAMARD